MDISRLFIVSWANIKVAILSLDIVHVFIVPRSSCKCWDYILKERLPILN